jgi:hypothetical protein
MRSLYLLEGNSCTWINTRKFQAFAFAFAILRKPDEAKFVQHVSKSTFEALQSHSMTNIDATGYRLCKARGARTPVRLLVCSKLSGSILGSSNDFANSARLAR